MNILDQITPKDLDTARDTLYHWRRMLEGLDAHYPSLLAALIEPQHRDAVLIAMASGQPITYDEQTNMERYHALNDRPPQIQRSCRILLDITDRAPGELRAYPLSMIAFLLWRDGDDSQAVYFADLALQHDPDNRLAELVYRAVMSGVPARAEQ